LQVPDVYDLFMALFLFISNDECATV
jgi:hypothetical protein